MPRSRDASHSATAARSLSDFGARGQSIDARSLTLVESGMAVRLVNVDRETPMLLPVDLKDWVPEDDLVHFVISAIETMKLPAMRGKQAR